MAKRFWVGTTTAHLGDWSWDDSGASYATSNWVDETAAKVAKPVTSDDVYFENSSQDILLGFNQSAVTLTSLNFSQTYTGLVGDNTNYLMVSATTINIGLQGGISTATGSPRIKINTGTNATTINIFQTSQSPTDSGLETVRLLGTHASNVLNVFSGIVGIASGGSGETAQFSLILAGQGSPTVTIGSDVTLATLDIASGATKNLGANVTTVNQTGGNYAVYKTATHATLNVNGGTAVLSGTGTVTTLNVAGSVDASGGPGFTVTTCTAYKGASLNLNSGKPLPVTFTNGIILAKGTSLGDISINYGTGFTISFA